MLVQYREAGKIMAASCVTEGNEGRTLRSMPSARFTLVIPKFALSENIFGFPMTN
jgi:hypothetical protein